MGATSLSRTISLFLGKDPGNPVNGFITHWMTQNCCGYQPFLTYTFSVCLTAMESRLFTTPRPRILAEEFRPKMCVTRKQAYMAGPDAARGSLIVAS